MIEMSDPKVFQKAVYYGSKIEARRRGDPQHPVPVLPRRGSRPASTSSSRGGAPEALKSDEFGPGPAMDELVDAGRDPRRRVLERSVGSPRRRL